MQQVQFQPCWAYLPALECVFRLLSSTDLASCGTVCRAWRRLLDGANGPWAAALEREFGFVPLPALLPGTAKHLLIAARTSSDLFLSGANILGLAGCPHSGRYTSPERLVLLPERLPARQDSTPKGSSDSACSGSSTVSVVAASAVPCMHGLGAAISVRTVAAGADFAVLLTWDGGVLDTRCVPAAGRGVGEGGNGRLGWRGIFRPPCGRATAVAAGGCWQDQHTVWAWGSNVAGQLGTGSWGSVSGLNSAAAEPAAEAAEGEAAAFFNLRSQAALLSWVATPVEVIDSALAASIGLPVLAACGDEHAVLLCRDGRLFASGSNAAGACGLPVVQLAASVFSAVPLPGEAIAVAVACGGRNSAAVTAQRRLLVCGANELGQAGIGKAGGAVYGFTDVGPSAGWHGMQRANQQSGGGGGEAAAGVTDIAVGSGSLYALAESGDVFSWGQGGQGELALGGNCRNIATPVKMPWAHGAVHLAASCGGRFGALVDCHGHLFTYGTGKAGALGHGDTAKRAVGRQVKALGGHAVHAVACGADWMLAVGGWRPPSGKGKSAGGSSSSGNHAGFQPAQPGRGANTSLPVSPGAGMQGSFSYKKVEAEPPLPRSPRQRRSRDTKQQQPGPGSGSLLPGSTPTAPRSNHGNWGAAGQASSVSIPGRESSRLRGRSGREQQREWGIEEGKQRGSQHRLGVPALPHVSPEAAVARRQRWMAEPPVAASVFTPPGSDSGSGGEGAGGQHGGGCGSGGREMAYLMRRQLKAFTADPRQRVLVLPKELSSRDRWKAHLMAEAWGLMHQSHGEGERRKLVVWKPSRGCKTLKPAMLKGWTSSSDSSNESEGCSESNEPGAEEEQQETDPWARAGSTHVSR